MALTVGPAASHSSAANLAKGAYEAFARRDLATIGDLLSEDVTFAWNDTMGTTTGTGRQALLESLARLVNATRGTAVAELRHAYTDADGRVVCFHRAHATLGGHEHDHDACLSLTIAGDHIVAVIQLDEQPTGAAPSWQPVVPEVP